MDQIITVFLILSREYLEDNIKREGIRCKALCDGSPLTLTKSINQPLENRLQKGDVRREEKVK